jgi:hypothetical protein
VIERLNMAPRSLLETQMAYTLARLVMVATKLGVFEALAAGVTPPEVARRGFHRGDRDAPASAC